MLQSIEPESKRVLPGCEETPESIEICKKILKISSIVIDSIDLNQLISYFSMKADYRPDSISMKL
jgi:hypothetical protein